MSHIKSIVDKTINELNEMIKDKGVKIILTTKARNWLCEKGYKPKWEQDLYNV